MDFFARQKYAKRKTRLLVIYLVIAVLCIVCMINTLVYSYMHFIHHQTYFLNEWLIQPKSIVVTTTTIMMITLISLIQWRLLREGGDALAARMGALPVSLDTSDQNERQLLNIVEEMAIASGLAMPSVYVMEGERGINAFVAGMDRSDAVVVVTQGAIRELTRQELQGMIGHEFSHILNSDMRINLQLISLLAGILFLSEAGRFVLKHCYDDGFSSGYRRETSANPFIFLLPMAIILFAVGSVGLFFARLIKSSISRQREYLADAAAVQFTRDNQGLASALFKISELNEGSRLRSVYAEEASHMCFCESVSLFSGVLSNLLSTHPSIQQRIKAIYPGWIPGRIPGVKGTFKKRLREYSGMTLGPVMAFSSQGGASIRFTQSIGQPRPHHLEEAERIIHDIPEILRVNANCNNAKKHSMQLVLALLMVNAGHYTKQALTEIKRSYGSEFSCQVGKLAKQICRQPRKQRLAIMDLATPALKQMTRQERKKLFEVLQMIIQLDHSVSRYEYSLYWLLKRHFYGPVNRSKASIHSLKEVQNQVAIVIAMMIEASGKDEGSRKKLFRGIMATLGLPNMLMPVAEFDAGTIHQAIEVLAQLSPIPKQSFIYALEDCITEDNIVAPEEAELLRTVAALMDCPVPPILTEKI